MALTELKLRQKIRGIIKVGSLTLVAGGVIGNRGDIVLDSIMNPQYPLGVADGTGRLLKPRNITKKDKTNLDEAMKLIRQFRLSSAKNLKIFVNQNHH